MSVSPLAFLLTSRGVSPTDICRQLVARGEKLTQSAVSQWLSGRTVPKPPLLPHLCELLALTPSEAAELYAAAGVPLPASILTLLPPEPQLDAPEAA